MSHKIVLKINDSDSALLDLTHHFAERNEDRLVHDPTLIKKAIDLMISTEIIMDSTPEHTYVVRDFKNNVSIVFKFDKYSEEEMEDYHGEVKGYETTRLVVTFKTIYDTAGSFQQYPFLTVFVIDDTGSRVENCPMQHTDYDVWSSRNGKKPNDKTWKWPKEWSIEHKKMLEKNTHFSIDKYPRPRHYRS